MDDGNALGTIEIEIVAHPSIVIGPGSQSLTRSRTLVIAQRLKGILVDPTFYAQKLGTFALPFPNDFLLLTVILTQLGRISLILQAGSIVALGLTNILTTDNPQHDYIRLRKAIAFEIGDKRVRRHLPLAEPKAPGNSAENFEPSSNTVRSSFELVRSGKNQSLTFSE
jgi:hypothetical protein